MSPPDPSGRLILAPDAASSPLRDHEHSGLRTTETTAPSLIPPTDPRRWDRAATELGLYHWVVIPSRFAAEALISATGGAIAATVDLATGSRAATRCLEAIDAPVRLASATPDEIVQEAVRAGARQQPMLLVHDGRSDLAERLVTAGAFVDEVPAVRLEGAELAPGPQDSLAVASVEDVVQLASNPATSRAGATLCASEAVRAWAQSYRLPKPKHAQEGPV